MINWLGLLGPVVALMTPAAQECSLLRAAHEALLKSSFTCERRFTVELNGDLKAREISRLTYRDGELARETVDKEVLDKNVVLEEGEGEAALELPFDCGRLERLGELVYELSSPDGTEKVIFVWDAGRDALRPSRWTNNETKRLLWKKLVIEAVAEYRNFVWE